MKITIAQRFRPFSHIPGVKCILPGTPYRLQIFPALIKVSDLSGPSPKDCGELPVNFQGPVEDFTVQVDLEKGEIVVSGETAQGYARYRLMLALEGLQLVPEKGTVHAQILSLQGPQMKTPPSHERLSLGNHKAQNWPLVEQRHDLAEIFPIWLKLGQMTPTVNASLSKPSLLGLCEYPKDPYQAFLNLWKAGFEGIGSPRSVDEQFQGFSLDPLPPQTSPLALLTQGAAWIRNLFITQQGSSIAILPNLPQQFHAGRMVGITVSALGTLHMEWSKKQARRLIFEASAFEKMNFHFQKNLKTMRLTCPAHPQGIRIPTSSLIDILPGERYLLDRFEH